MLILQIVIQVVLLNIHRLKGLFVLIAMTHNAISLDVSISIVLIILTMANVNVIKVMPIQLILVFVHVTQPMVM